MQCIKKQQRSIKKFIQSLEPLRTTIIQIGEKEYTAELKIDVETEVKVIVKLLK
jgi:hypothetical protein